ncbi:MAG: YkoF family thiamine/hydroxymethylpyrimidine-binding protein [Puniceicoccaceae bacterium]
MKSTFEVSLYALTDDYETVVLTFLDNLEKAGNLSFSTGGMSTRIEGEAAEVFAVLGREFERIQETGKALMVVKAGPGILRYEGRHNRQL